MIPDEAVEAALSTLMGATGKVRDQMRLALEAAAPYMLEAAAEPGSAMQEAMALAWERGVEDGNHHRPNPYRKAPDA